jgi:hypothetical protein
MSSENSPDYSPVGTPERNNPESQVFANLKSDNHTLTYEKILIIDTEKVSDFKDSFTVYVIKTGNVVVKRRYSEFESVRKLLLRMYPFIIIPPIPKKHSLTDYAKMQSKAKDDQVIIDQRKRQLQFFLNRVASHEILGCEVLFQKFLEANQWSDVLFSQNLVRNSTGGPTSKAPVLPKKLKNPDLRFVETELYMERFGESISSLEKLARKIYKKETDIAGSYSELGAVFNAFSLHESKNKGIAMSIEKLGQAMDSSCMAMNSCIQEIENTFVDRLHEYVQYNKVVTDILKLRNQKHGKYEDFGEQLDLKRFQLQGLENDQSRSLPPQMSSTSLGKVLGSIADKIHTIIDNDPETTRKTQIAKIRESISELEKSRDDSLADLTKFSSFLQQDLERFQKQRSADIDILILRHAKLQRKLLKKKLSAFEETLKEIHHL